MAAQARGQIGLNMHVIMRPTATNHVTLRNDN